MFQNYFFIDHVQVTTSEFDIEQSWSKSVKAATRGDLENFTKFKGKHPCQSFFFNKVTGLDLQLD